jgi:hypothetical protein
MSQWVWSTLVTILIAEKPKYLYKIFPISIFPTRNPTLGDRFLTRVSAVKGWRLTAWAMARLPYSARPPAPPCTLLRQCLSFIHRSTSNTSVVCTSPVCSAPWRSRPPSGCSFLRPEHPEVPDCSFRQPFRCSTILSASQTLPESYKASSRGDTYSPVRLLQHLDSHWQSPPSFLFSHVSKITKSEY